MKPNKFAEKKIAQGINTLTMADILLGSNVESSSVSEDSLLRLPSDRFYVSKQVRTQLDDHSIYELSQSLILHGQLQPVVVYPADPDGRYKIFTGERRWRASALIPGFMLAAIIKEGDKDIAAQLVENIQREELSVLDTASALRDLFDLTNSQESVARSLGWYVKGTSKPNINRVSKYLGVLKLPPEGLGLVEAKVLTDLTVIELLRKISELDLKQFSELVAPALIKPLSRSTLEAIYKKLKSRNDNPSSNKKTQSEIQKSNSEGEGSNNAFSHVRTAETKPTKISECSHRDSEDSIRPQPVLSVLTPAGEGVVDFDYEPQLDGQVWVKLQAGGDHFAMDLSNLKLASISYVNCSHQQLLAQEATLVAHIKTIASSPDPEILKENIALAVKVIAL